MRKAPKRRARSCLIVLVVLAALLLVGVFLWTRDTGPKKTPDKLADLTERGRQALDSGWTWLNDRTRALADRLKSKSAAYSQPRPPTSPPPIKTSAAGAVSVYFAPCSEREAHGIDDELIELIGKAEKSVYCAFFELQHPEIAKALIAKRKAGVDVKIVADSDYKDRDAIRDCIRAGIAVVFDNRTAFMHDKFCVVDGQWVWTGSTNATTSCMYRNDNNSVLIQSGRLAEDFTSEFKEMFWDRRFGPRSPKNTPFPSVTVDSVSIECYFAPEDGVRQEIIDEIQAADATIDFMAFTFTSSEIAQAMVERIEHGVRVRGLFESKNAGSEHSQDDYLARNGAEIHRDGNKYFMHNKAIILDGSAVVTGSYNFSDAAEEDNDEDVLIIHSPDFASAYTVQFEKLISYATK